MIESNELNQLIEPSLDEHLVSIYIPTHRAGVVELKKDKTRFKNCVDTAEDDLKQLGVREKERVAQMKPAHELLRDEPFWRQQGEGLAVFLSLHSATWYKLSESVSDITVTAHKYHLKPLLFFPSANKTFYILAFSPNSVRLLRCTRETVEPVATTKLPKNITDALGWEDNEQVRHHVVTRAGADRHGAVFHGHGGAKDHKDVDLNRYVREIANAVDRELKATKFPLVFAGDDKLMGIYQSTAKKVNLLDEYVRGNHDDTDEQTLRASALPLVERYLSDNPRSVLDAYYHLQANEPERVSNDLATIVKAAGEGKVAELLLDVDTTVWGNVSLDYSVEELPKRAAGAVDVLDVAATETYRHGGNIHETNKDDMPGNAVAAAILRY